MKDIILIKLYRNEFSCNDYHDWMLDRYPLFVKELERYIQEKGKSVYLICMATNIIDCTPLAKPFAEIEYTGNFSPDEREKCFDVLKRLSSDIEWYTEKIGRKKELTYREFSTLMLVKIRKIEQSEELIEVDKCKVDCSNFPIANEEE